MNMRERLNKISIDETRVVINGIGTGTMQGKITDIDEDYIEFTLTDVQTEKTTKKTRTISEVKLIPISKIEEISFGEQTIETSPKVPKTEEKEEA